MKEFLMGFFNLDSRFLQTMGNICIPAKLSLKYIEGKRKSYINPARLFLFSMIFFFAIANYAVNNAGFDFDAMSELRDYTEQKEQAATFDSLIAGIQLDSSASSTIRKRLFPKSERAFMDSIALGDVEGAIQFGGLTNQKFYLGDIISMNENEFLNHYNIEGTKERLFTRQMLRVNRDPKAVSTFVLGNMLWAVVLSVFFLALVMKLLYVRSKQFFVEHLILQMHIHSFIFITIGLLLLFYALKLVNTDNALLIASILTIPFIFLSFKFYYKQGFFKTLLKTTIIGFSYIFIATFCSVIIMLISMVVF